jgi:hypothetical protein
MYGVSELRCQIALKVVDHRWVTTQEDVICGWVQFNFPLFKESLDTPLTPRE